ncbi:NUDIX domain-containing protein [Hoyosella subflava]|uniref:Nudix family hydrolase n=1 Tax=Hoyosella subflava (strain DSM 45089 / JCM 17490 / NBRC 109087 / DQS3-9A1) TaxID=443218 RepID=F6EFY6_HOYSD|nr:NUDIX domain-containing protein [Hoyosella subflava]AEF42250.1 Nudix family hydrolase [Hoyosella subflava DQS3-9A1]
MSSLHASARAALHDFRAPTNEQDSVRHTMLAFLDSAPDGCLRKHAPGHITASSLVMTEDRKRVLLTLHPKVGRWIQLGGHCEETDATIHAAALREAEEESGITGLRLDPRVLGLHTHPITCSLGVPTRHLDVRFLVWAPASAEITRSEESVDLAWWPVAELPPNAEHDTINQLITFAEGHESLI